MWPFSSVPRFKTVAQRKRAEREALLAAPKEAYGSNTPSSTPQDDYLRATAKEIVARIEKGEWTATQVLEAYIARAILCQETTNCLTEVLFDDARKEAELLDQEFSRTRKLKGPLHGVPVSFKDVFDIKGYDSSLGFTSWAEEPRSADAKVVELVRAAGGIPFVKTNVPQTLMFFECVNPLWGRTLNPHSAAHTSGGSSGGEAALLAMDGSALGWGSDIGGSLRIPASYCGIYSLKPGWMRVSGVGTRGTLPGFEAVREVMGPMGRSIDDLELAARIVFGQRDGHLAPAPVPYRDVNLPGQLRFGYYKSDGFVKVSPVCQRAVEETVEALRRAGHECVEIKIPDPARSMQIFMALISADGNETLLRPMEGDPYESGTFSVTTGPKLYAFVRSFIAWIARTVWEDHMFADVISVSRKKSVRECWEWAVEREKYERTFEKQVWAKYKLDGIIAPAQAVPALPHDTVKYRGFLAASALLYNVVDSPVGTIPVTRVQAKSDAVGPEWIGGPGSGSVLCETMVYGAHGLGIYNAERMAGLPVGVQVVGRKWEDEKVVAMMRIVDQALGSRGFGPGSWAGQRAATN